MKKFIQQHRFSKLAKAANTLCAASLMILALAPASGFSQTTYTFTNCNATGQNGPTQAQVTAAYAATNLNAAVTINTIGIQQWTVPQTGAYQIEAYGAQGGVSWGLGAKMSGTINLTSGTVLKILVGQAGGSLDNTHGSGGGGSFVVDNANNPIVIAGGGGGRGKYSSATVQSQSHGSIANAGQTPPNGSPGGTLGGGGAAASGANGGTNLLPGDNSGGSIWASGGGGFYTNGGMYDSGLLAGGRSFFNNGLGGAPSGSNDGNSPGGFGGGGGCGDRGAGGGGYSGGGGGYNNNDGGGGGGSFSALSSQTNVAGFNSGHGRVIITALCNINLTQVSAVGPGPICAGSTVTLTTDAVSNYTWNTGANTSSLVLTPTITTSYSLTATSPSNCVASAVITVTVDNTPTVTAVASSPTVCAGKPLTLSGAGATTYTWTNAGVTDGVAFTPATTADYTVTGTNACGTASAAVAVTVNPLPTIGGAANNPTICNGSQVILNGTGSVSGYTWTGGVLNNTAFTPAATNNYTVTGVSAEGCTNTAVVTVTVYITPTVPPVASPTAICYGATSTISSVGAISGYTWTGPNNFVANTASVAVSPTTTTTYTLVRASGACSSTAQLVVTVNPLPIISLGAPAPSSVICANSAVSLSAVGAITYTWYPGGFQGGNITLYPNYSATPINYTVVASNANCTIAAVTSVSTNPLPSIAINTATQVVCAGSVVTMTASGATSYTWQSPISAAQQNQAVVTDSPLAPTLYNVSGTNGFGCVSSGNMAIIVNASPNLTTSVLNPGGYICAGGIGTLTAIGTGPVNYNWSTGSTANTTTVNPTVSTVYTVTGTNPNTSCQSVNTVSLAVYISTFVVTSPTAVCKGSTVTISAAGAATSYTWNVNPSNTPSINVSPLASTVYYVTGTTGNCSTTQSVSLIVNPIPNVGATVAKTTICRFEAGILTGNGATSYSWTSGPATQDYTVYPTVTTTYTLVGTNDATGCSKTVQVTQYVSTCVGIAEQNGLDQALSIFPNPSTGEFTIQSDLNLSIRIINALGQTVKTLALNEYQSQVNVKDLANGLYFIRAEKDGNVTVKKLVIAK